MSAHSVGEELPYIGSKISLISSSDIRYEGILDSIDPVASTVSLRFVQSFGTEDRVATCRVPASAEVYSCIVFQGKHIKDLTVCSEPEPRGPPPTLLPYPQDPAIISVEVGGLLSAAGGGHRTPFSPPSVQSTIVGGAPARPVFHGLETGEGAHELFGTSVSTSFQSSVTGGGVGAAACVDAKAAGHSDLTAVRETNGGQGGANARSGYRGMGKGYRGGSRRGNRGLGLSGLRQNDGPGPRGVVGELQGRPNAQLKSDMAEEFDFEAMNSKFEKAAVMVGTNEYLGPGAPQPYDKNVSFFDSISCEALGKRNETHQQNYEDPQDEKGRRIALRQHHRSIDVDTFGEGASQYSRRFGVVRRGGSRGRGRGGGRAGRRGPNDGSAHTNWPQRPNKTQQNES